MHCPNCDMFSTDPATCSHCGKPIVAAATPQQSPSRPIRSASSGGGGKWLVALIAVVAIAVAVMVFTGGSGPIPAYMDEGPVTLSDEIEPGKINIVDMYSEYCPPCRQIAPWLEKLDHARDDVHVVKIDINRPEVKGIDWSGPVAKQFKLKSIPHFIIIGPDGDLQHEGKSAYKEVVAMIEDVVNQ